MLHATTSPRTARNAGVKLMFHLSPAPFAKPGDVEGSKGLGALAVALLADAAAVLLL